MTFDFPANPEDGYIDASVYFMDVPTPVDITQLTFGPLIDGKTALSLVTLWLMTFEGSGLDDIDPSFQTKLTVG